MLLRTLSPLCALVGLVSGAAVPELSTRYYGGKWTALTNITSNGQQLPRQEHSVAAVGTDVYAIGGILSFDGTKFPTVALAQKYSTKTGQWTDLPDMPVALNHPNVVAANGKVYVLGGLYEVSPTYWGPSGSNSVYDPKTNKWTALPDMPADLAVGAAAAMVHGSTIYLAGGLKYTNLTFDDEATVPLFSSFDTITGKWTALPDMPAPRDHAGKGVVGDNLYVLGGREHGHYFPKADCYKYNTKTGVWTTVANMTVPRGGGSSATIGNLIYVAGGEGNIGVPHELFPQMEAYDTKNDRWIKLTNMTRPIHGTDAAAVNGKIYIPGGGWELGGAPTAWVNAFTP